MSQGSLFQPWVVTINVWVPKYRSFQAQFSPYTPIIEVIRFAAFKFEVKQPETELGLYYRFGDHSEWLSKWRLLNSFQFRDPIALEFGNQPLVVKDIEVSIPRSTQLISLKLVEDTPVWIITHRLLRKIKRKQTFRGSRRVAPVFEKWESYGLYFQEKRIDEEEIIYVSSVEQKGWSLRKVYEEDPKRDLTLNVFIDSDEEESSCSISFDSNETVNSALLRVIKYFTIKDFSQYSLFAWTPKHPDGIWLDTETKLGFYELSHPQSSVQLNRMYRVFRIFFEDGHTESLHLPEVATVEDVVNLISFNHPSIKPNEHCLFTRKDKMTLQPNRAFWSYNHLYPINYKRKLRPVSIYNAKNGVLKTFNVDFNCKLNEIMRDICSKIGMEQPNGGVLELVSPSGLKMLDLRSSLLEQNVDGGPTIQINIKEDESHCRQPRKIDVTAQQKNTINIWNEPNDSTSVVFEKNSGDIPLPPIRFATLNRLVIRLTSEQAHDDMKTVFMTYTSYTTPRTLFNKLLERFHVPPPPEGVSTQWQQTIQRPIQLRVCNALKFWIKKYKSDFDQQLIKDVIEFVDKNLTDAHLKLISSQITEIFSDLAEENKKRDRKRERKKTLYFDKPAPPPKLYKGSTPPVSLLDFDEEEIARQLTLDDFSVYSKIKPSELLNQAWNKAELKSQSPNVLLMIDNFNQWSIWVANMILDPVRVRVRAQRMEKMIKIAEHLMNLQNFNILMAFIGGFSHAAVERLKFTKALISKRSQEILTQMMQLMNVEYSYKSYREHLHKVNPPCNPFIGLYLSDLTAIDEGNVDYENGLINFAKHKLVYKVISEVEQYQQVEYNMLMYHLLHTFLWGIPKCDEPQLYRISLAREPKNADKSQIL